MFSVSKWAKVLFTLGVLACAGCSGLRPKSAVAPEPQVFYTVTGEIALARGEPRVAALQYAVAAAGESDAALLRHAAEVTGDTLQPTLAAGVAARWIEVEPQSLDAQRAAAKAALALYKIDAAAAHYRVVLLASPDGIDAEFARLETEIGDDQNTFGGRQLADRLVAMFPPSAASYRLQGLCALRADDPAAAVKSFSAAMALPDTQSAGEEEGRRELRQTLWRARILSDDVDAPLAAARERLARDDTPSNRLDYALLLMTAQRNAPAAEQLQILARIPDTAPLALRLLGLIEFQDAHFDMAAEHFTALVATGKYLDDAFYYLALIADRRGDPKTALRLYAQVQGGDNMLPALLRATTLLQVHGAAPEAQELLDRLLVDEPRRAPEIIAARARMFGDAGDLAQAYAVLARGIIEYPDSADLRYALASLYDEEGRGALAERELNAVVKRRPDDPAALNALGYTLADHDRQLRRARKLIGRAYAAAPKNAAILDSLGWVLFRQGRGAEAVPYLTAAYADDRGGDIAAHLGEVLWSLGKPAEAEQIWTEASASDADNRLLKATRQRLQPAG